MSKRTRVRPMVGVLIALLVVPACARDDDAVASPPAGTDVSPADVARYATEHRLSGLSPASLAATPQDGSRSERTIRVEVAETGSRFVPDARRPARPRAMNDELLHEPQHRLGEPVASGLYAAVR